MTTFDAGLEREELTRAVAAWLAAGSASIGQARRYTSRINRLARVLGRSYASVHAEIGANAEATIDS
jgi:hypothetical protein